MVRETSSFDAIYGKVDVKQTINATLTFLLLVLIMNSLARCVAGWGSNGRILMLLSSGSPGTIW